MNNVLPYYKQRLNLQGARFIPIVHEEAMVAIVYKVILKSGLPLILKISNRAEDYFRDLYFLKFFANSLPVPHIIQEVPPEQGMHGAILMDYLPGNLLKVTELTDALAYEIGSRLALIHNNRVAGFGDLIEPKKLSKDARVHFTYKFEEELEECSSHLQASVLKQCRRYFDSHIANLTSVDGPCIIHRDFRPGNVIIHESKLQGIIDWASARAGFAEEDFYSIACGDWSMNAGCEKSFFAGYGSIRPVPDYAAIMPLLRLGRAFAKMGFLVKHKIWENNKELYQSNRRFIETFYF